MPISTRSETLQDITAKLSGHDLLDGVSIFRNRSSPVDPEENPQSILIYTTTERLEGKQGQYKYEGTFTVELESRVVQTALVDEPDLRAMELSEFIKQILFSDPTFRRSYQASPDVAVRVFKDIESKHHVWGEVLTLTLSPKQLQEFSITGPEITGVTISKPDPDGGDDIVVGYVGEKPT